MEDMGTDKNGEVSLEEYMELLNKEVTKDVISTGIGKIVSVVLRGSHKGRHINGNRENCLSCASRKSQRTSYQREYGKLSQLCFEEVTKRRHINGNKEIVSIVLRRSHKGRHINGNMENWLNCASRKSQRTSS
ncbi:hypothetical protein JTE90_023021 [Oedothorax gibbosus]|uniref:EF-hand domain-containing protein n=1 Tax=Oedothorax gibbosus TaxID=931172 RepID=A0AAV6V0E6_9ARAC|nr:hypothetical protein JTE90_023021 [Oedothorax gibbosus]